MKNLRLFKYSLLGFMLTCVTFLSADIIWPAIMIADGIFSAWPLIGVSVVIEAVFFYCFIKELSFWGALFVSLIGNAFSAFFGTIIMALFMLIWHGFFDGFLGATFHIVNIIATFVLMYTGSALIELGVIKLGFGYKIKQLLLPVLVGNLTTYALAAVYKYYLVQIDWSTWFAVFRV